MSSNPTSQFSDRFGTHWISFSDWRAISYCHARNISITPENSARIQEISAQATAEGWGEAERARHTADQDLSLERLIFIPPTTCQNWAGATRGEKLRAIWFYERMRTKKIEAAEARVEVLKQKHASQADLRNDLLLVRPGGLLNATLYLMKRSVEEEGQKDWDWEKEIPAQMAIMEQHIEYEGRLSESWAGLQVVDVINGVNVTY